MNGLFLKNRVNDTFISPWLRWTFRREYGTKLFDKILIANRGEIACRVIKTAKKLGIKTVAIYSEVDGNARHVALADEAVCVGSAPTSQSYLKIDRIMEAIKKTGAQAVHPGYGFLSENQAFAAKLHEAKVEFIGPSSASIAAMGDKIESKKLAKKAGVHVIPGFDGVVENVEEAIKIANQIGYPVMIKASAGGGGKGMRIAWNDQEAKDGFRFSSQEAKSSFGDDRLLIEKFIDNPRHIEIQVMGDKYGNIVYLPERECSIQRRNQKVIEEAPSCHLDEKTRKAMGEQAVMLSKAVNYYSAGTVEFLVDSQRNFYFLEMNTRLQVEHPITEYITGLDLVELMIRVAANQKLPILQENIKFKGWAMESRIYAEDPTKFLPSIGRLSTYIEPNSKDNTVRVDSGIVEGGEISVYYDPLISKLVTYGEERQQAIDRMKRALDSYVIKGVTHNIPILYDVLSHQRFVEGKLSTKFLAEEYPGGFQGRKLSDYELDQLCAATAYIHTIRALRDLDWLDQKVSVSSIAPLYWEYVINIGAKEYNVRVENQKTEGDQTLLIYVANHLLTVRGCWNIESPLVNIEINNSPVIIQYLQVNPMGYRFQHYGTIFDVTIKTTQQHFLSKYMLAKPKLDTSLFIMSPMPGSVLSIAVKEGDQVIKGQEIAVVEAMKMQNVLSAQRIGKVKKIHVKSGSSVAADQIILEFEPEDTPINIQAKK